MSSIVTNSSAMNALSTLRNINSSLQQTQDRIGSGLQISSAKDNAAYFSISESMKSDSGVYGAIDEGLTLTANSLDVAHEGALSFQELANQFVERVAFAQGAEGGRVEIEAELKSLVQQMKTTISQSTFNGDDLVGASNTYTAGAINAATGALDDGASPAVSTQTARNEIARQVVTGISRASGSLATTTIEVKGVDLSAIMTDFEAIATGFNTNATDVTATKVNSSATDNSTKGADFLRGALVTANAALKDATAAATSLGLAHQSVTNQQEFLKTLTTTIDTGVGAMVDADMEEEAARLQALQVQQQLATQALSIANQGPQNLLSLFR